MTYQPGSHQKENGTPPEPQTTQEPQHQNIIVQPNLPDYRPKGMGKGDKFAAWVMAFLIIGTLLTVGVLYLVHNNKIATPPRAHPSPTSTSTSSGSHSPLAIHWYVVVNIKSGYTWWLDSTGQHFTRDSARKFIQGHPGYHIYALKPRR